MIEFVQVEQIDRDAVQSFHSVMASRLMRAIQDPVAGSAFGEDESDNGALVQAFARHRIAEAARNAALENEVGRLREAVTPYGETKCAYMSEFSWTDWLPDENGVEQGHERVVPWTVIKEIMAAIRKRAGVEMLDEADCLVALKEQTHED